MSALHAHDGTQLEVAADRISKQLGTEAAAVAASLVDEDRALLGRRAFVVPRAASVQWLPGDDRCVACDLTIQRDSTLLRPTIDGTVFCATPKMKPALYVVGAVVELVGIVLVASPDLIPGAVALAGRLRTWERIAENKVRSVLHLPPRVHVVSLSATVTGKATISGSAVVGFDESASVEEKVSYLLRRDQESQKAANALATRVERLERETPEQLEKLRGDLQEHVETRLSSRLADLRAARLWGVAGLIIGLGLGTVANLLR